MVVDCTAIVDALIVADDTEDLRALLGTEALNAPTLLDHEVVSALRGLTLRGDLSATRAEDALTDYGDLPIRRWPSAGALRRRAFQLRADVSAYDAAYLVLAEALECPLLTRDRRLARSSGHDVPIVVLPGSVGGRG
jgi:predicted nucleic acid-binding protein